MWTSERTQLRNISIYKDNAKTLGGAKNELKDVLDLWKSQEIQNLITAKGMRWKSIIPRAPNQGGLWKAAVKSAKHHMKKNVKWTHLHFWADANTIYKYFFCIE